MLYDPNLVEVPEELRENLQEAHDKLASKAEFINRLHQGEADLMASAKTLAKKIETERAKYAEAFSAIEGGANALDGNAEKCRKRIRELEGQIADAKDTAADFNGRIRGAKEEFGDLQREFKRARRRIVNCFRKPLPAKGVMPEARKRLDEVDELVMSDFMLVYLAIYDGEGSGVPFPQAGQVNPKQFFEVMSGFFQTPTFEEAKSYRAWFEAMIWGGDEVPEAIKIPADPPSEERFNFDKLNFGV